VHVHILGIAGTFMGGVAAIAKAAGFRVTGSDRNVYPPMSTQLEALGIELIQGYGAGSARRSARRRRGRQCAEPRQCR
jgi:UDP-N-acetylmuramate: L-alanyl-gamma-D-glutamyl-meso-diaminopimelate ligase